MQGSGWAGFRSWTRCFTLNTAALLILYTSSLIPGILTSLPSLGFGVKTSSSSSGSCPGSSSECLLNLWFELQLQLFLILVSWVSRSSVAPRFRSSLHCIWWSRLRRPSSDPSFAHNAHPCPPTVNEARTYQPLVKSHQPICFHQHSVKLDHAVTVSMVYVQQPGVNSSFKTFQIQTLTIQTSRQ